MLNYNGFALLSLSHYNGHQSFRFDEDLAQSDSITCPVCGKGKTVNIALAKDKRPSVKAGYRWMVCQDCCGASIAIANEDGWATVYPPRPSGRQIKNLPTDVMQMWEEANLTYSVGAYTSAVLMCRKIVFATAVKCGLPAKNDKGRAPKFEVCVNYLVDKEIITTHIRDNWADSIRTWGNAATHEIQSVRQSTADKAIKFTEQVLLLSFEYPSAAKAENEDETDQAGESSPRSTVPRTSGNYPS